MSYLNKLDGQLSQYRGRINSIKTQHLSSEIAQIQNLSSERSNILEIHGIALTEGTHKHNVHYSAVELQRAAKKLIGIKVYFDEETGGLVHNPTKENETGYITNAFYDPEIRGIRYDAIINKTSVVEKIANKALRYVSAGVGGFHKVVGQSIEAIDLFFKELSLVIKPADINTSVEIR